LRRLLTLGSSGFVGRTIAGMPEGELNRLGLELIPPVGHVELTDPTAILAHFRETRPDCIIHLAAQTFVPESFRHPEDTFRINFFGTLNVLKGLRDVGFAGRLVYVSSGDVYGAVRPEQLPVTEMAHARPRNPYAVSKVAAEALCYQWSQTEGIDIVIARPFNHIGPGQSERFVVSDFARQIVEIKLGRRMPQLAVGDIDVTRDFTDVRDVVRAYFALCDSGVSGETYNICSGVEWSVRSLIVRMLELTGIAARLVPDSARMRKQEQRRMVGSSAKLHGATGWAPECSIETSLRDILNYWELDLKNG